MINPQTILSDRYLLEEKLSDFSNRQTWRATDLKAECEIYRQVIIKILIFSPQMNWEQLKLFEREASVLRNINHPKIPKYLDSFYREASSDLEFPSLVLVQELICGSSLKAVLDKQQVFPLKEVKQYAKELFEILIYLHELSPPILHRDIKPSNLILGEDKKLYLVDFGAVQDKAKAEGATFTVVGSSGYTPPEQLWGKAIPASDLYALGATLIHLLTGKSPAELPQRKMRIHFHSEVQVRDHQFTLWLERLVHPAQERRFSTAREALKALHYPQNFPTPQLQSTQKVSPNYTLLCLIFLVGFLFPVYRLHQASKIPPREKGFPLETRTLINYINRHQELYFIEKNIFGRSFEELGISSNWDYYSFHDFFMRLNEEGTIVFNYGISTKKKDKSYVGAVFQIVPQQLPENLQSNQIITTSIICEANSPGMEEPPVPTLEAGNPICAEGTTQVK